MVINLSILKCIPRKALILLVVTSSLLVITVALSVASVFKGVKSDDEMMHTYEEFNVIKKTHNPGMLDNIMRSSLILTAAYQRNSYKWSEQYINNKLVELEQNDVLLVKAFKTSLVALEDLKTPTNIQEYKQNRQEYDKESSSQMAKLYFMQRLVNEYMFKRSEYIQNMELVSSTDLKLQAFLVSAEYEVNKGDKDIVRTIEVVEELLGRGDGRDATAEYDGLISLMNNLKAF